MTEIFFILLLKQFPAIWKSGLLGFLGSFRAFPESDLLQSMEKQDRAGQADRHHALGWKTTSQNPLAYWCKSWLVANTVLIMVKHWRCNSKTELRRAQISCSSTAEGGKNKQDVGTEAGIHLHRPETLGNTATKFFYKIFCCQISGCFAEGFSYH